MAWYEFPKQAPAPGAICWIRVFSYYSDPFLAEYISAAVGFTSLINSITYPVYVVGRWKNAVGSELILNGDFVNSDNWELETGWSIADGKASFNGADFSKLSQDVDIVISTRYLLQFTILDCASETRIGWKDENSDNLWYGEWGEYHERANGVYSVEVTAMVSTGQIRLGAFLNDPSFSITGISLKQLL